MAAFCLIKSIGVNGVHIYVEQNVCVCVRLPRLELIVEKVVYDKLKERAHSLKVEAV